MAIRVLLTLTAITAALALVAAAARPGPDGQMSQTGRPILSMTGSHSGVTAAQYRLAASQEVFDKLWLEHLGDDPPRAALGQIQSPQIDFETVVAIFIFAGNSANTGGYTINELIHQSDAITVRYAARTFQTAAIEGQDPGEPTRPWAMVLIPATGKTIYLEEKITALPDQPMVAWKQQAVFPGRIGIGRPVGGTGQSGQTPQP